MDDDREKRLAEVLRRYVTDPGEWEAIRSGQPLLEASGLDSLSVVNLVTELELLFETRFDPESLDGSLQNIHTLSAFLDETRQREG